MKFKRFDGRGAKSAEAVLFFSALFAPLRLSLFPNRGSTYGARSGNSAAWFFALT
jgi:hypothetical protein